MSASSWYDCSITSTGEVALLNISRKILAICGLEALRGRDMGKLFSICHLFLLQTSELQEQAQIALNCLSLKAPSFRYPITHFIKGYSVWAKMNYKVWKTFNKSRSIYSSQFLWRYAFQKHVNFIKISVTTITW